VDVENSNIQFSEACEQWAQRPLVLNFIWNCWRSLLQVAVSAGTGLTWSDISRHSPNGFLNAEFWREKAWLKGVRWSILKSRRPSHGPSGWETQRNSFEVLAGFSETGRANSSWETWAGCRLAKIQPLIGVSPLPLWKYIYSPFNSDE
jgi:hypothetical protein